MGNCLDTAELERLMIKGLEEQKSNCEIRRAQGPLADCLKYKAQRDEARRWARKLWRENEALKAERDEALQYARNVWSTGDYVYIPEEARRAKRQGVE